MAPQAPTPTEVIGLLIDTVAAANQDAPMIPDGEPRGDFECVRCPRQPFSIYMKRFTKFRRSPDLWVMALCMVNRLQREADMPVAPRVVHRLMVVALTIAVKLCFDSNKVNSLVSSFGGVDLADLNDMERTFLTLSNWEVTVWCEEYEIILKHLEDIEDYANKLCASGAQLGGGAMLLPDHITEKLDLARANVRGRASVIGTPSSASPLWSAPTSLPSPLPPSAPNHLRPHPPVGAQQMERRITTQSAGPHAQRRLHQAVTQSRMQTSEDSSVLGSAARASAHSVATI
eukprot:TRINITY_DN22998_c0_g1_i1.p1 TRINITY_DN22998_c0_g1~~TRINITY_DN22998_c0_g1_i1.p1  ORF type:complete len:314 (+),score=90.12 TRINITY_DN22998_c0_g1_i1:81-944(+)